MISLGFSVGHDKGAVLIKDGEILVGITEERITRIKHDGGYSYSLPTKSIEYCISAAGISFSDIDRFVYSTTELPDEYGEAFESLTGVSRERLEFIPHHLAHAFSAFKSSGFNEAAVVVADASGSEIYPGSKANDWFPDIEPIEFRRIVEAITIYSFGENSFSEIYKRWTRLANEGEDPDPNYSSSVGLMYSTGSLQLILDEETNSWPAGKLMGLASYADPLYVSEYPDVASLGENLFIPHGTIEPQINHRSDFQSKANVAGIYQREQERILLYLAKQAKEKSGLQNLCVAGGSFLNCNSNEIIERSGIFDHNYYVPCADDSGIPLGCAWYGQTETRPKEQLVPYLGRNYSEDEILEAIQSFDDCLYFEKFNEEDLLVSRVSDLLLDNKVIGWMQGGSEIGPRALGNRSILANPSTPWMVNYINSEIKGREWYRPFAPSVLEENQSEIFELDSHSPYMLITTKVREEWRNRIPAVTHFDYTSRYQTVSKKTNQRYHSLISDFYKKSGVPLLLNTSFNGRGEPIVESPRDAILTFLNSGLHTLVINDFIITRC